MRELPVAGLLKRANGRLPSAAHDVLIGVLLPLALLEAVVDRKLGRPTPRPVRRARLDNPAKDERAA